MPDSDTFAAHAIRCRQEADEATLDNVRDRSRRAAAAWSAMAVRSASVERAKEAREARAPVEHAAPIVDA